MRAAARAAREVLDLAGRSLAPGITTDAIDAIVHRETIRVSTNDKHLKLVNCGGMKIK
jgi:methionine aminopeptidase